MVANFFVKIFPYVFLLAFFIYFEFSPVFFYENELAKHFSIFFSLYIHGYVMMKQDLDQFWFLIFGLFMTFLEMELLELLLFFFIILSHLQQKKTESLVSFLIFKKLG